MQCKMVIFLYSYTGDFINLTTTLGPAYNEFGYNENPVKIIDYVNAFVPRSTIKYTGF